MSKKKRASRKPSIPVRETFMHVFLGVCIVLMVTMLMLPQTFGFQDFRQWAGMYVDNWCHITAYSGSPDSPGVLSEQATVGQLGLSEAVWTAPSHNQLSCAHWGKEAVCGRKAGGGWIVKVVRPSFGLEGFYLGDINICEYDFPSDSPWFIL